MIEQPYRITTGTLAEVAAQRILPKPQVALAPERLPAQRRGAGFPSWLRALDESLETDKLGALYLVEPAPPDSLFSFLATQQRPDHPDFSDPVFSAAQTDKLAETYRSSSDKPAPLDSSPDFPSVLSDEANSAQEELASRWVALRFSDRKSSKGAADTQATLGSPPPVLVVLSIAGGVGKTTLAASLGQRFAALGERVLLVDGTDQQDLASFFGAPSFSAAQAGSRELVQLAPPPATPGAQAMGLLRPGAAAGESTSAMLAARIQSVAGAFQRVVVDLQSSPHVQHLLDLAALGSCFLVPLTADVHSSSSLQRLQQRFPEAFAPGTSRPRVKFCLTQYREDWPLHVQMQAAFRRDFGEDLVPVILPSSRAPAEALTQATTPLVHAPSDPFSEKLVELAAWLKAWTSSSVVLDTPVGAERS